MSRYAHSKELFDRATRAIAGGVNNQWRAQQMPHPLFFSLIAAAVKNRMRREVVE